MRKRSKAAALQRVCSGKTESLYESDKRVLTPPIIQTPLTDLKSELGK